MVIIFCMTYIIPQPVKLSLNDQTCVKRMIVLPGLYRSIDGDYHTEYRNSLSIGSLPLLSASLCVTPLEKPLEDTSSSAGMGLFGWSWLQQRLNVKTGKLAKVDISPMTRPIAFSKPLVLPMNVSDHLFTYTLAINNKTVTCEAIVNKLHCPVTKAEVKPSQTYTYTLSRHFKAGESESLKSAQVTTLNAVQVVEAAIKPGDTIYAKPQSTTVVFDKQIVKAKAQLVKITGETSSVVVSRQELNDKTITLSWDVELERESTYELRMTDLEAKDGSSLESAYASRFLVSGGPKVTNVSVPKTGVPIGAQIVLTFDQALNQTQDISKLVTVAGLPATIVRSGAQVVVTLQSNLTCADFTIQVKPGVLSAYDIAGKETWTYGARTICHTVGTIGYSSRGRAISAYYFGNGGTSVLYVGAIHGSEGSSSYILQDWIQYLEQNAKKIPADRQIVVVPTLNPDGLAAGSRNSATNVNLNRNFATNDWKKDINDTNGTLAGGGGKEPMSEPETKAIAALANRLRPRLTLSYHAVGSVAIANGAGISNSAAAAYATGVGYNNGTGNSTEIFQYEITGTFDDWLAQRLGAGSVVVELGSYQYRNFSHHSAAMWNMATR